MRKDFLNGDYLEKEISLRVRVPSSFDEQMERKIDEAFADALYKLGCELVDSREYRDISKEEADLDDITLLVRQEIALNGVSCHGLTEEEAEALQKNNYYIGVIAGHMSGSMQRVDGDEYRALEMVFEDRFPEIVKDFRQDRVSDAFGYFCLDFDDHAIYCGMESENEVKIFHDGNDNLFCQLSDEDFVRPLRDNIQDIKDGDAFFFTNSGWIRTSADVSHQNFDEPDAPWIAYGDDGECYFEEDIGEEIGAKVRALLKHFSPHKGKETLSDMIRDAQAVAPGDVCGDTVVRNMEEQRDR